ncbi:hypothetical protein Q4S45_03705 [Massilia sp. R2A-15]|nr:hypothetical protein [Massilia sp. R2A-15]WLI90240.1 hypothetical protein Q4S45_03705 [Massilia sp. R2A-15]
MRQVILIHAHKNLDQLSALVVRMADDEFLTCLNPAAGGAPRLRREACAP